MRETSLAAALGACQSAVTNAAAILRAPSTHSFKHRPPVPITVERLTIGHVDERLLGRCGFRYRSPAHTPQQVVALVHALIGVPPAAADLERGQSWSTATAGGRRVVTVTPTSADANGGQR